MKAGEPSCRPASSSVRVAIACSSWVLSRSPRQSTETAFRRERARKDQGTHPQFSAFCGKRSFDTDHSPNSPDRTILTVKGSKYSFGFSIDDVISQRSLYVRSLGIFIGDARFGDFQKFLRSGLLRRGEDIISRIDKQPEQTLDRARGEVPALSLTGRAGRHAVRYIPLGLPAIREKYGLDFDGNVFINKQSAKATKEDLTRMEWSGDEIYFRTSTGAVPDFRGRETSARQSLLESCLPVVRTSWENEGIEFNEEAFDNGE